MPREQGDSDSRLFAWAGLVRDPKSGSCRNYGLMPVALHQLVDETTQPASTFLASAIEVSWASAET